MKRVFLLDDDPDLSLMMKYFFERLGYSDSAFYASFEELKQNLDFALSSSVAFLDVNLGVDKPTGLDAYQLLAENGYKGRVVIFTGHARSHPLVQKALQIPGVILLEKPASREKIAEVLV